MRVAAFLLLTPVVATGAGAAPLELGLPIACEIGKTCWVQNYVDHDLSPAARDYACGGETYDGHDGTDIRVLDTTSRADVIASASGTVKAARDGMADNLMRTDADRAAVEDRECGNGVVVDHLDGWQTQYCHMRAGSVVVKAGDKVERGTRLGEVGYSGMAAFPHVHLTVRKDGNSLDPFASTSGGTASCGAAQDPLWSEEALAALAYNKGDVISTGFYSGSVEFSDLETGTLTEVNPSSSWPAMIAFIWAINLSSGDTVTITLHGPGGLEVINTKNLDRNKAQYLLFAGKKRPPGGWPVGDYVGSFVVSNGGKDRLLREWHATIN